MKTFIKALGWMVFVWCIPLLAIALIIGIIMDLIDCVKYRELPDVTDWTYTLKDVLKTAIKDWKKLVDELAKTY